MSRAKHRATPQGANAAMLSAFEQAAGAAKLSTAAGKSAVDKRYRPLIDSKDAKTRFTASVDMDAAFSPTEPDAHRWDFGPGVQAPGQPECAVWVEPHSAASTGEVKTMLAKLDWLQAKLQQPAFAQLQALTQACARLAGHGPCGPAPRQPRGTPAGPARAAPAPQQGGGLT